MKALVLNEGQAWPVLQDFDLGAPAEGWATMNVSAAALNRRDYWICKGKYPKIDYPVILGSDVCGIINGKEYIVNPGFDWGDKEEYQSKAFNILGLPTHGALAENVHVPQNALHPKPDHLTTEQAAALPLAGVTAFRALFSRAKLNPGEKLLVSGVGGGVASMAMLLGLAHGAEVFVTSGENSKVEKAVGLGAKDGANYREKDWSKELKAKSGGFDVIIDSAAGDGFSDLVKLLKPGGRIVFYGGTRGPISNLNPQLIFWRQVTIMGSTMGSPTDFTNMLEFVNRHKVVPQVDKIYGFDKAEDAFKRMEEYDQFGKIVLTP